mgnify:CR=1 FL=1
MSRLRLLSAAALFAVAASAQATSFIVTTDAVVSGRYGFIASWWRGP